MTLAQKSNRLELALVSLSTADKEQLLPVRIGSAIHRAAWAAGWRTHHVEGITDWMEHEKTTHSIAIR